MLSCGVAFFPRSVRIAEIHSLSGVFSIPLWGWRMRLDIKRLITEREIERYQLHASHLNEQMVHVLKTIGFDKRYQRGVGQYLYDENGEKYLDLLSGWGVFAIGRNHPTVREALTAVLDSELPNLVQMGVSALSGVLAERLLEFVPHLDKVFFSNSGTEAIEAAIKFARAATRRGGIVYCSHAFHGLTYGSLSLNGDQNFRAGFGPLLPECIEVPFNDLAALEQALAARTAAASLSSPSKERASSFRTTAICKARLSSAENTEPCSLPTKSRPGSVGPADFLRASTGASSPTWCCSPKRCPAATCRSVRS